MSRKPGQKPHIRTANVSTAGLEAKRKNQQAPAGDFGARLPTFSKDVVRRAIEAGICPWCNRGPYKMIASHTTRVHGVDARELRDLAGLTYSTSLLPEETRQKFSDRAHRQREAGVLVGSPNGGRGPHRLSEAGKDALRRSLDATRSPEQLRAATAASHTPEVKAKRSESVRKRKEERRGFPVDHGQYAMYARGCRCQPCKDANAADARNRRKTRTCLRCGHPSETHAGIARQIGACSHEGCACRRWRSQP